MIRPAYLQKGDYIGLIAMSNHIDAKELSPSLKVFEEWGLKVILGESILKKKYRYAGTEEERRDDFQKMLDNPTIKAIFSARGGYGTHHYIDEIDFSFFQKKPKWVIGYSDITTVLCTINNLGIECIHGPMPKNFSQKGGKKALESLRKVLFGKNIQYQITSNKYCKIGEANASIIGGNLCTFNHLIGTPSFPNLFGKILLIEDINEQLHNINRMMLQLKRTGFLKNLAGLIVGHFTESIDDKNNPFGKNAYEIIQETVSNYQYPVVYNFPVGHIANNVAIPFGGKAFLKVEKEHSILIFDSNNQY